MINDNSNTSRCPDTIPDKPQGAGRGCLHGRPQREKFPTYAFVGIAIMVLGELSLFSGNYWIGVYFTPVQWTGYILFMDGLHKRLAGTSLISDHKREFFLLLLISIGSWLIFEAYNVLLQNWRYIGLPDNMFLRYLGYAWSFATISPGIFITYQVLNDVIPGSGAPPAVQRLGNTLFGGFVVIGALCLVIPLIWPSTYMTPLVWMGFAFFLDPINHRLGERSILTEFFTGRRRSLGIFFLSGLACGLLWEFWNYWAEAKWEYFVPYWGHIKLFEMPVLGFLGFLPFTIECFAIYKFIRKLVPIPIREPYLG
jgi:hypothetical protein